MDNEIDDDRYDTFVPEMDQPSPYAFCDVYDVHEAHTYRAVNGNFYDCHGFTQEDVDAMEEEMNRPPCEHGLSASLCAGPMHYPPDM